MIDRSSFALGRKPTDHAALAAAAQFGGLHLIPPRTCVRDYAAFQTGLYGNDTIGDCTAAALANAARGFSLAHGGPDIPIDPAAVVAFYAACCGVPDTPDALAQTEGSVMSDVLARQARDGYDIGEQTALVGTYGTIPVANHQQVANAIALLGGAYLGVDLAVADQTADVWDTDTPGDQTPGSWGGHALMAWGYDGLGPTDQVMLGTWGMWQPATWRWVASRAVEAHAVIWHQLVPAGASVHAAWAALLTYERGIA